MVKTVIVLLLSCCFSFGIEKGNLKRFRDILKRIEYPEYRASDKNLYASYDYDASENRREVKPDDISEEALEKKEFTRNFKAKTGIAVEWISSSNYRQINQKARIEGTGLLQENTNVEYLKLLNIYDTSASRDVTAQGNIRYECDMKRLYGFKRLPGTAFFGLNAIGMVDGNNYREHQYLSSNSDGLIREDKKKKNTYFYSQVLLEPGVGIGKKKPVLPVYQAFEIERILKMLGRIDTCFSDSTMFKIISLNASMRAYKVNHELYWKYFMNKLQQILSSDSTMENPVLDTYTWFKIYEIYSTRLPEFFAGRQMSFYLRLGGGIDVTSERDFGDHKAQRMAGLDFWLWPYLNMSYCFAIFQRLFIVLSCIPHETMVEYAKLSEYPQMHSIGFETWFFLTNRILLNGGGNYRFEYDVGNTSAYLDFRVFIEDHVSFNVKMETLLYHSFNKAELYVWKTRRNEKFTIGFSYDL